MRPDNFDTLDARLSAAQLFLRDGFHDDLSRAVAEARNRLSAKAIAEAKARREDEGDLAAYQTLANGSLLDLSVDDHGVLSLRTGRSIAPHDRQEVLRLTYRDFATFVEHAMPLLMEASSHVAAPADPASDLDALVASRDDPPRFTQILRTYYRDVGQVAHTTRQQMMMHVAMCVEVIEELERGRIDW